MAVLKISDADGTCSSGKFCLCKRTVILIEINIQHTQQNISCDLRCKKKYIPNLPIVLTLREPFRCAWSSIFFRFSQYSELMMNIYMNFI